METDALIVLMTILLPLSFIAERITNLIKLFIPDGFLGLGNVRYKEDDPIMEKKRERRIFAISLISGELVAFALKADLFTIINQGTFGWSSPTTGYSWIIGCVFTGFFLSWGSKFWHDLLEILLEMKNIRRVNVKAKTLEVKQREVEVAEKVAEQPVASLPVEAKPEVNEDKSSLERIKKLHPKLRQEVEQIYRELLKQRIPVRITDTLRTFQEQEALYAIGRTKPGNIVTKAKPGQSYHNYGLALDFCLLTNDGHQASWNRTADFNRNQRADWDEVVSLFKHYGWEWGGDWASFKDYPHLQKTYGYSTAKLLEMHNKANVDSDGYVNI
ncbi:MAG: M15 family metallopeptidase [Bacteroidota bacterium]